VIAANWRPDHTTIARFRQRHETALAGLFGEVLALCAARSGWPRPSAAWTPSASARRADPASRPARVREAKRRLEEELRTECAANAAYEAYRARGVMKNGRRFGSPPKPYQPPEQPTGKINVTDPDSRNV